VARTDISVVDFNNCLRFLGSLAPKLENLWERCTTYHPFLYFTFV